MPQYKFNAPWHTLKHTWVGTTYRPEFFQPIRNTKIRESLQKIAEETEEDYQNLISTLKSFDVEISRPTIDPDLTILDYVDNVGQVNFQKSKSFTLIPRPPMQPRDSILVVNEEILATQDEAQWYYTDIEQSPIHFDAPLVTVVGKHLIVDCRDHPELSDYMQQRFPNHIVVPVMIGGHNDAVFCPVKPGLIVSTYHHDNYTETFPGWEIKYIENQSWNAIPNWRKFKHANVDKWWVPEADNNPEFSNFVDTWLGHWLGYVKETVFDVNMLQINDCVILVNNYNKEMFDFFKVHNIEPIITPFRHRFFWDGGIHCVTGDVYREGESNVEYISTSR
jgi:hypothetical protein